MTTVTTNPYGQKETVINGKKYTVKTDRHGEEYVVIDGKRVNLKEPLFDNYFQERLDKASEELNEAKENVSASCDLFDYFLNMVRSNRKEKIAFKREYGSDIDAMNAEQQEKYKTLLEMGGEYTSGKNRALANVLSYTNQTVSLACNKRDLLNQASLFGV